MSLEVSIGDIDQAIIAAARSETPVLSQALVAKERVIVQSSSFICRLLLGVGRSGLQCDLDRVYSSSSSSSSSLWLPEMHFWLDSPCWMLSLCRLDSLSFLPIFFCSFVVSTEFMPPRITFLALHCLSRNILSLSGTLSALSHYLSAND